MNTSKRLVSSSGKVVKVVIMKTEKQENRACFSGFWEEVMGLGDVSPVYPWLRLLTSLGLSFLMHRMKGIILHDL